MKRSLTSIAMLFAAFFVQAQSVSYRIDPLTDGSLYLVEISTPAPDSTGKVGPNTETPIKVKDFASLSEFTKGLKVEAAKIRAEAETKALIYESAAEKIAALIPEQKPLKSEKAQATTPKNGVKKQ